jgi:serine phosphatase RsbU (regulator of sigma subunit)
MLEQQKDRDFESNVKYAELLQHGIFPKHKHFDRIFSESFIFFKPLNIISGDFYWLAEYDGLIYLIVGDCAGHGVPGAILVVLIYNLFDYVILKKKVRKTNKILREIDKRFIESFSSPEIKTIFNNDSCDIALCCIDTKTKIINYCGARRNALVVNKKGINVLRGISNPVGGMLESKKTFNSVKFKYNDGDALYLESDGFYEQIGGKSGKKYKAHSLHKFLGENSKHTMIEQHALLYNELKSWMGNSIQTDDICIVGVRL